jgi:DNA polymerase/3'-5' exonuclease PolX
MMNLATAQPIAASLLNRLSPHCQRIDIAGSVRRLKPEVKDIELLAQPLQVEQKDLFGTVIDSKPTPRYKEAVLQLGKVLKGAPGGRYMQIRLDEGINLDLFMPQPHDYYRQLAIRTGGTNYSVQIATAWAAKGWCGTPGGLRLRRQCIKTDSGWQCTTRNPVLPPAWQSEAEFFQWLGMEWLEPKERR